MGIDRLRPRGTKATADATPFADAVAALYEARYASLFRYLDRVSGDPQLAADVAQEAFIRLFRRGTLPDQPAAWLVTVAHNLLEDDRRRTRRRLRLIAARPEASAPAPADPTADVDGRERRAQVRAALSRLSERDRTSLLLYHSGYSYREIGAVVGLRETSVGTILLRAGAAFRRAYEEIYGVPD